MSINRSSLSVAVVLVFITGCVTTPSRYTAYGKSQDDLMRDRYQCYQETQQRVSGAYVNRYGGAANSSVIPSCGAFNACLAARGYLKSENGNLVVPSGALIDCTN